MKFSISYMLQVFLCICFECISLNGEFFLEEKGDSFILTDKELEIAQFPQELKECIEQQIRAKTATEQLWKSIEFYLSKLKEEKNISILIKIEKNKEAENLGGFCAQYGAECETEKVYVFKIFYNTLENQSNFYRPVSFLREGRYRFSLLQVPNYIALAHELCHILNVLEYCLIKDDRSFLNNSESKNLQELICNYLNEGENLNSLLNAQQKNIWGNECSYRDEISVILGKKRKVSDENEVFLGETIFMREHYSNIFKEIKFVCWSHEYTNTENIESLNTIVEKFEYTKQEQFNLLKELNLTDEMKIDEVRDAVTYDIHIEKCKYDCQKVVFYTEKFSFDLKTGSKQECATTFSLFAQKGSFVNNKMMFLYLPGKIKLFSPYLRVGELCLILNTEIIKKEEKSIFMMSQYNGFKEKDEIKLTIKPFIPSSEN